MLASKLLGMRSKRVFSKILVSRQLVTVNKSNSIPKIMSTIHKTTKVASTQRGFCALYYEKLYKKYLEDPMSVDEAWRIYFESKATGAAKTTTGPSTASQLDVDRLAAQIAERLEGKSLAPGHVVSKHEASEVARVLNLIRSYQMVGHEKAHLDPLELRQTYGEIMQIGKRLKLNIHSLDHKYHGFSDAQLDKEYFIDTPIHEGFVSMKKRWKLRELIESLEKAYCGSIGIEYMHIQDTEQCNWIRNKFEKGAFDEPTKQQKLQSFDRLAWAVTLGDFLQSKYNTQKRFGLEGCDSFIPGLKCTIDELVKSGVKQVTIGMPHRGRLNVLANVLRKPLVKIFQEFQGEHKGGNEDNWGKSGDVKYHLGTSYKRKYDDTGNEVEIHLLPNPSHLEAVDPVVCGFVRSHQHFMDDQERIQNVGILVHGDAAFAGQGVVYETMQMADLYNYRTGGTIHFIVNNQIGFTTTQIEARSGLYSTDLAKTIGAPIFHVNADDVLAVEK